MWSDLCSFRVTRMQCQCILDTLKLRKNQRSTQCLYLWNNWVKSQPSLLNSALRKVQFMKICLPLINTVGNSTVLPWKVQKCHYRWLYVYLRTYRHIHLELSPSILFISNPKFFLKVSQDSLSKFSYNPNQQRTTPLIQLAYINDFGAAKFSLTYLLTEYRY